MSDNLIIFFSICIASVGFAVSCFGISLSRVHRHEIEKTISSFGSIFFCSNAGSSLNLSELSFALLSCSQILRSIFIILVWNLAFRFVALSIKSAIPALVILNLFCGFIWDILPRWIAGKEHKFIRKCLAKISSITLLIMFPINKIMTKLFMMKTKHNQPDSFDFKNRMKDVIHEFEKIKGGDQTSKQILSGVLKYQERSVKEIMVPRVQVFAIESEDSILEASKKILEEGFTRTPIYEDSIDNIIGIVITRDLLSLFASNQPDLSQSIKTITKSAFFVPESLSVANLLQEFKVKQTHLAIVVDEYGGTAGVVTIEDALEELVGDISDEYDHNDDKEFFLDDDGSYIVDATINLNSLEDNLQIVIHKEDEYESLNGYIFHKTGFIPKPGFIISHDDFDIEVISSNEKCVLKTRIYIHQQKKD